MPFRKRQVLSPGSVLARASVALVCMSFLSVGRAEDMGARVARLNANALAAFRRSDARTARRLLRSALREGRRSHASSEVLATTYSNLAMVSAVGLHDHRAAARAFRRALREDPSLPSNVARLAPETATALRTALAESPPRFALESEQKVEPLEVTSRASSLMVSNMPAREVLRLEAQIMQPSVDTEGPEGRPGLMLTSEQAVVRKEGTGSTSGNHRSDTHARWFVEMSAGVGFSALGHRQAPDQLPTTSTLNEVVEKAKGDSRRVDVAKAEAALRERGWNCDTRLTNGTLRADNCAVATKHEVSAMEPIFDFGFGYHFLPRFALAASALVQRLAGEGPLAGVVIGLRSEYLLTAPAHPWLHIAAVAGVGAGSLRARGRRTGEEGPAATNSSQRSIGSVVSLGMKAGYRTNSHITFSLTPLFSIGLPNVLYDLGTTGGVEVMF